jgi:hypothetical protein
MQVTGSGHVICYNRVRNFKDGIDLFPSRGGCFANDVHNNEVSECMDDGAEMDYSERNTRNFCNRYTNVFQGISEQPIFGGPTYIFRNVVYNIVIEPFKLHSQPSGALIFHNTTVREGDPLILWTPLTVHNCVSRNNLFIGTAGKTGQRAYDCDAPMVDCDFDYDGFGGGPWKEFLKWNGVAYRTLRQRPQGPGVQQDAVRLEGDRPAAARRRRCRRRRRGAAGLQRRLQGQGPGPRRLRTGRRAAPLRAKTGENRQAIGCPRREAASSHSWRTSCQSEASTCGTSLSRARGLRTAHGPRP